MNVRADMDAILGLVPTFSDALRDAPPGATHPLEAAALEVRRATDSRGLKIILMPSNEMFDILKVGAKIRAVSGMLFDDRNFYIGEAGRATAARHLSLLANLYAELLLNAAVQG
jgi:hypothetical protein